MFSRNTLFVFLILCATLARSECIPVDQARQHIGESQCVSGRVVRVKAGNRGVHYLDFCDDFRTCPFTVVVFPHDLKSLGDVRQLAGRTVEIRGDVKEYDGRAEIILEEPRQLGGAGARLPALPKDYDVEKEEHYSAGRLSRPYTAKKSSKKRVPAQLPIDISDAETGANE